ncbi:Acg family FMN-binding oxidoreductase [Saccharopolyspora griseoalba]|uniref:Acg family FMN-binding oxidoreductase n=1 Tax=Saccharopolyspora griseoalba TaxID=1431848 RepID=A0ABW2LRI0_9PSEU
MSDVRVSAQEMREVCGLADRAPSLFNSQPWQWRGGGDFLELLLDRSLELPETDPDKRELVISNGVALQHALLALRARGWLVNVLRLPDASEPELLARIEVLGRGDPAPGDGALVRAARRREVDRREYAPVPVPPSVLAELASAGAAAQVSVITGDQRRAVAQAFARAARVHAASDRYRAELASWTGMASWSADGAPETGVPWRAREHDDLVVRDFGWAEAAGVDPASNGAAGCLLLISTGADDRDAHLRAGEALGALLCRAELAGLASCPLSEALEVRGTRALVRREALADAGHPQMMVRVGWPRPADGSPRHRT